MEKLTSWVLRIGVIAFAASLMAAFVWYRGGDKTMASGDFGIHYDPELDAPIEDAPPTPDDNASIVKSQDPPPERPVPSTRTNEGKPSLMGMNERYLLSSSKSISPIISIERDTVMNAMDSTWNYWNDSVTRAEAMRTLVKDRYGYGSRGMITVDSLQRRVEHVRLLLSGTKAPSETPLQRADVAYLDSLLKALITP